MTLVYSIDTSSMIAAWDERYPPDVFPPFWTRLQELIAKGKAGCIDEVRVELAKKNDELLAWADEQDGLFHPIDTAVQRATSAILADPRHQRLTDSVKGRSRADPFVIALAQVKRCCVVTQETSAPRKIRVPDVCAALRIECIGILDLMRREKWTFKT
jgi:uncharacterized protein DUF4411